MQLIKTQSYGAEPQLLDLQPKARGSQQKTGWRDCESEGARSFLARSENLDPNVSPAWLPEQDLNKNTTDSLM